MLFCKKQVNQYFNLMRKIIFTKLLIIFFLISGCGYSPIFSDKNSDFSIVEIRIVGDNKINNIINNKLNYYKNSNSENFFSLDISTKLNKEISSKDSKGNPKTYNLNIIADISVKNNKGDISKKILSKSINYNNIDNKFDLKKFETKSKKNLAESISEEIIVYLQMI